VPDPKDHPPRRRRVTVAQAAPQLGLAERTVRDLMNHGRLPLLREPGGPHVYTTQEGVDLELARRRGEAARPPGEDGLLPEVAQGLEQVRGKLGTVPAVLQLDSLWRIQRLVERACAAAIAAGIAAALMGTCLCTQAVADSAAQLVPGLPI
jgi:hypothetical protein